MIDKTLRANLALGILGVAIVGFSGAALFEFGSEIVGPLFATLRVESVAGLAGENRTIEAEVTGVVDAERILVEKTTSRLYGNEAAWHKYYYAVFDQTRMIGVYVYSDLVPDDFVRHYGKGVVVLHGIWEEMPRDIRLQEPMNRVGEQMRELVGRGVAMGQAEEILSRLTSFAQRNPLRIDRRLNLQPARWKLEKAVTLATMAFFFVVGIAMVWTAVRRQVRRDKTCHN